MWAFFLSFRCKKHEALSSSRHFSDTWGCSPLVLGLYFLVAGGLQLDLQGSVLKERAGFKNQCCRSGSPTWRTSLLMVLMSHSPPGCPAQPRPLKVGSRCRCEREAPWPCPGGSTWELITNADPRSLLEVLTLSRVGPGGKSWKCAGNCSGPGTVVPGSPAPQAQPPRV